MSGIEIAGLALGAFPILLHLLDDYRKAAETTVDWWHLHRAYKEWTHNLNYHRTAFELSSKLILTPLMDDDDLEKFLSDPNGQLWKKKRWETRLRERLPDTYDAVCKIIDDIYDITKALQKELGVDNAAFQAKIAEKDNAVKGKAAVKVFFSARNINFQMERFRIASKKESRERLFAQLEKLNDRLRGLISGNDQVVVARRTRDHRQHAPTADEKTKDYWHNAKGLYEALSKASHTGPSGAICRCASHVANLQLATKDPSKTEFGVLYGSIGHNGSSSWNATRIEMVLNANDGRNPTARAATAPKRVGFAVPTRDPGSTLPSGAGGRPIQDLCAELSSAPQSCIGFIDEDEQRFIVYPENHLHPVTNPELCKTTLNSILSKNQTLTRLQRYTLAHTVAVWFLRLGSTPWIRPPIQANIIFRDSMATGLNNMDMDKIYIGGELANSTSKPITDAIQSLGICLLELCFGCTLESYKVSKGWPGGAAAALTSCFDYAAAIQWSDDVVEEAGPDFEDAIKWCLQVRKSNDESWRKDIWARVIVPLKNCSNHISQRLVF